LPACGYQFQNAQNPLVKLGVKKIYVQNFSNQTIRPGIEHFFTTAMVREIRKGGIFEIADSEESADAVLKGTITSVEDLPSASALEIDASTPVNVAASFTARVACQITLRDKSKRVIFQDVFGGSKSHPASIVLIGRNRIDPVANATAPLINESEQRIAVRYLSDQMMFEAYQKMVDLF
jgi:hypothetical protein